MAAELREAGRRAAARPAIARRAQPEPIRAGRGEGGRAAARGRRGAGRRGRRRRPRTPGCRPSGRAPRPTPDRPSQDARSRSSRSRGRRSKAEALDGLDRWKARHPEAAPHLEPADVLVDGMRGRSSLWYRVRVNLIHVPEADRPAQEALEPDYDPWAGRTSRPGRSDAGIARPTPRAEVEAVGRARRRSGRRRSRPEPSSPCRDRLADRPRPALGAGRRRGERAVYGRRWACARSPNRLISRAWRLLGSRASPGWRSISAWSPVRAARGRTGLAVRDLAGGPDRSQPASRSRRTTRLPVACTPDPFGNRIQLVDARCRLLGRVRRAADVVVARLRRESRGRARRARVDRSVRGHPRRRELTLRLGPFDRVEERLGLPRTGPAPPEIRTPAVADRGVQRPGRRPAAVRSRSAGHRTTSSISDSIAASRPISAGEPRRRVEPEQRRRRVGDVDHRR